PEIAFEEYETARFVADRLTEMGLAVHCGLAGTGVVGTLRGRGASTRAVGLRADIDALPNEEKTGLPYQSIHPGRMHACGHDGHTAMLLGAAKYLAETRRFDGVVHFIFQPAEENEGGGRVMIEDGLFDRFPMEQVYGLHNWPGMPVGQFAVRPGPMMASFDVFEITVHGRGAHAAMPHVSIDPVVVGAQIVLGLQTIASRATDPQEAVVVSTTQFHAGDAWNVIPETGVLRGTVRTFRPEVQDATEASLRRIAEGIAAAHGATAEVRYERRYPTTVNSAAETERAAEAAAAVVGLRNVHRDPQPCMGSEDFAFLLQQRPGCYIWMGNGDDADGRRLHNPRYDFNDEALVVGAAYWAKLAERILSAQD
ncbi:MAG: M20 aminoacylase family protein, partial [Planctomycetia bacterium]